MANDPVTVASALNWFLATVSAAPWVVVTDRPRRASVTTGQVPSLADMMLRLAARLGQRRTVDGRRVRVVQVGADRYWLDPPLLYRQEGDRHAHHVAR